MENNYITVLLNDSKKKYMGTFVDETKYFLHIKDVLVCDGGVKYQLPGEVSIHKSSIYTIIDLTKELGANSHVE